MDIGNPDIPVRPLIHPASIVGQLGLILVQFVGKVVPVHAAAVEFFPGAVPIGKTLATAVIFLITVHQLETTFLSHKIFTPGHCNRTLFTRGLHLTFDDIQFGLVVRTHFDPVEPFIEDIK